MKVTLLYPTGENHRETFENVRSVDTEWGEQNTVTIHRHDDSTAERTAVGLTIERVVDL